MQDGISLIQTAEGAISEIQNIVHRIRELSVKASNDTYNEEDRDSVQEEINGLMGEVTRISEETEFNRIKLLNGDLKDTTAAKSTQQVLTLEQAMKSVGEDKVGLIFIEENEFTAIQAPVGSATSNAFGMAIKCKLVIL